MNDYREEPLTDSVDLCITGLDAVSHALPADTSHVISLVDPGTVLPASLHRIAADRRLLIHVHDALDSRDGKSAPVRPHAEVLCQFAASVRQPDLHRLLIHCHMGRSRSAAAAAIVLLALGCPSPADAFRQIVAVRDPVWPNRTLIEHGDKVLGCSGDLIAACESLYEGVRLRHPDWVENPQESNILT